MPGGPSELVEIVVAEVSEGLHDPRARQLPRDPRARPGGVVMESVDVSIDALPVVRRVDDDPTVEPCGVELRDAAERKREDHDIGCRGLGRPHRLGPGSHGVGDELREEGIARSCEEHPIARRDQVPRERRSDLARSDEPDGAGEGGGGLRHARL